jgi:hypothetical protein
MMMISKLTMLSVGLQLGTLKAWILSSRKLWIWLRKLYVTDYRPEWNTLLITVFQDAEFVSETVVINRLYHRELIARMSEIEELEKKWNCKIDFPSTEQASDVVTISGPEYQVPQALDAFLVCRVSLL